MPSVDFFLSNELLLLLSVLLIYGSVLVSFLLFGKQGLTAFTVIATITANIEVMVLVTAFGLTQTLGNVLFASTFLITDILSENYGQKEANRAVHIGIFSSVCFILISRMWFLYLPIDADSLLYPMRQIFTNTPRVMLASLVVYGISQKLDVLLYHRIWAFTKRKFNDSRHFLWVRNNGSTLISQLVNTVLFTVFAFFGVWNGAELLSVIASTYVIFVVTSFLDTPVVYLSRRWNKTE